MDRSPMVEPVRVVPFARPMGLTPASPITEEPFSRDRETQFDDFFSFEYRDSVYGSTVYNAVVYSSGLVNLFQPATANSFGITTTGSDGLDAVSIHQQYGKCEDRCLFLQQLLSRKCRTTLAFTFIRRDN